MSLLVNPDSFCETAENFFDLSFLVKDARATVGVDDSTGARVSLSRGPGRRGAQDPERGGIIDGGLQGIGSSRASRSRSCRARPGRASGRRPRRGGPPPPDDGEESDAH